METLGLKQIGTLTLIIAMSAGAGGSLLARAPSIGHPPSAVLRDELDRLETRWERRVDRLTERVRAVEVAPTRH